MMARMLSQLPLPLMSAGAAEIAPGVGVLAGEEGSLVTVHGLATFAWDAGDEAGRRLAAVQLVRLRAASQGQVAEAFGVDPVTIWRWDQALAAEGVAGLVPSRRGPKGASKLTPELAARITALDAAGATLREIAAATGVSTFSVRNALGRVTAGRRPAAGAAGQGAGPAAGNDDAGHDAVPVLPDPVPRDGERALARWGLLGEGAVPVFTPGARYPLAGLLLALPALEGTGLLEAARAGLRPAQGRVLRADRDAADRGVPGPGRGAAGRGRHPGPARRAGPGARPGPGPGSQDDPPQAGRTRRRREGSRADHGGGPPPRRGPARCAGVPPRRRARPRLLRHPAGAEDARGAAEVPRPRDDGNLGHRFQAATRYSWSSPSRRTPWPASCAACSPRCGRSSARGGG